MSTITGYKEDTDGTYIQKDRLARLVYSMDWSLWLPTGAVITAVDYSIAARINDANPPVVHSEGIADAGTVTYAEISGGSVGKVYTVTAVITLDSGETDRRAFRIKVENRLV
jgi:hypothetical protein